MSYQKNTEVKWKWGNGYGTGKIEKVFTSKVTRTIDGSEIIREASKDNPAYLIKQEDGEKVLKSHSEVKKA